MLNQETRRKIDSCRDILVGKLPDPKAQIEQITYALIYKFMSDMDKASVSLGGKASFFVNGYAQYAWDKLLSPKLGGNERLALYSEAMAKLSLNPHLPQLFRDIFKDAFLPYRDPETLNMFLKEINWFTYSHSEDLGDAFEYLLSVMSSQGDAGQFRTPRHIIDFIVEVVDPKKGETILDPACGTAGFLISSYKHILQQNMENKPGDKLTPDEKTALMNNMAGYDISPDMVRLSLVNMYLHGFPEPHIYEYDALTDEGRWEDSFDVIMANPPFMSPKGGIRPHKRFSIQANRSEVLFVDYIAEHLMPNGRAGVIVPEGIIFQSGTAYKALRKMLVDNYLFCVVSLPAGVFNPYAGVKTSILLMYKTLAKQTDKILFVKIENDGFDLGARRREITGSDFPQALINIKTYLQSVRNNKEFFITDSPNILFVSKQQLAENGDYNLSIERYRENTFLSKTTYNVFPLSDVAEVLSGQSPEGKYYNQNKDGLPFYQGKTEFGEIYIKEPQNWTTQVTRIAEKDDILMSVRAPVGPVNLATQKICIGRGLAAIRPSNKIYKLFLFYYLRVMEEKIKGGGGSVFDSISKNQIEAISIPVPPLNIQQEIVAEIESYQKIIDGARQVVENYKPQIKIDPKWPMVELGEVCRFTRGPFGSNLKRDIFVHDGYCVYEQSHAISGDFSNVRYFVDVNKYNEMKPLELKYGDLIMSCSGTMGKIALVPENIKPGIINQALLKLTPNDSIDPKYLKLTIESVDFQVSLSNYIYGSAIKNVASVPVLKQIKIPLPSLYEQKIIVAQIEKEQQLVNANKELIQIYEQKIKDKIAEVWET